MEALLADRTTLSLEKALDGAALRQRAIAHNVANVNTPGYKRYEVGFEEELRRALGDTAGGLVMRRTHPGHLGTAGNLSQLQPEVIRFAGSSLRPDGNNVDIDAAMVQLAQNGINYEALTRVLVEKLGQLRYVINEGRR